VDPSEASQSYVFRTSTVTISRIYGMSSLHYFAEGDARAPGEEVVPEPADNKVVVFEEFFIAGLHTPPWPALADIQHKFRVQLYQLTPNAIVRLSKYIWAALSFGGISTSDGFAKRYEVYGAQL
jgi:hypothetical protein